MIPSNWVQEEGLGIVAEDPGLKQALPLGSWVSPSESLFSSELLLSICTKRTEPALPEGSPLPLGVVTESAWQAGRGKGSADLPHKIGITGCHPKPPTC